MLAAQLAGCQARLVKPHPPSAYLGGLYVPASASIHPHPRMMSLLDSSAVSLP